MKRIFFMLLLANSAFAQDTTQLPEVAVRAIKVRELSPFAKTNVSAAQMQKQNLSVDLPFLVNYTPSVVAASDAGNGVGYTNLRIRGTDATRINITLNGVPFNDPESNGAFFVNLPDIASSVSGLQIQRGVGSSTNGGAAFGASMHLNTTANEDKAYVEAANSFGSFNTWKNTLRAGTGLLNDRFSVDARMSRISSDGFVDRASTNMQSYFVSAAYRHRNTDLRFTHFMGNEKTYQAWYGIPEALLITNRRFNSAGTEKPGAPYDDETDNYHQGHYQLAWTQRLNTKWVFNNTLFYVRGKGYYQQYKGVAAGDAIGSTSGTKYKTYGLPDVIIGGDTITRSDLIRQLWLDNRYYGSVFSLQYTTPKTAVIVGGTASAYDGKHYGDVIWAQQGLPAPTQRWYDLRAEKNEGNVYAKWEQQLVTGLRLFTDLQVRHVQYNIGGFRNNPMLPVNNTWTFFNPKAGLTYSRGRYTAFASFAVGSKEPNRDDFEAGIFDQPRPERLYDTELGLQWSKGNARWAATFYNMQYRDQLVLTGRINDVGAYTRSNVAQSYRRGLELEGSLRIASWLDAGLNLTLSRNRILNFTEFVDDYDNGGQKTTSFPNTPISFSPNVIGGGTVTVRPANGFSFTLLPKYVSRQYLDNTGNATRSLDAYFVQDIIAEYILPLKTVKRLTITAAVYNLFDEQYEPNGYSFSYISSGTLVTENFFYPMAGRNFMVGVNVRL